MRKQPQNMGTFPTMSDTRNYILVSIRLSKCYLCFHLLQIFITCQLLYLLYQQQTTCILEITVVILLLADLCIKYLSEGRHSFLHATHNIVDISAALLLVCLLCCEWIWQIKQGSIGAALLVARWAVQGWRLFELAIEWRKQFYASREGNITLSSNGQQQNQDDIICH